MALFTRSSCSRQMIFWLSKDARLEDGGWSAQVGAALLWVLPPPMTRRYLYRLQPRPDMLL